MITMEHTGTSRRVVSRECMVDAHSLCPGWAGLVWAEGAAYIDSPLVKTVCGCPSPECDCTKATES